MQLSIFDNENDYEEIILSLQEIYFNKILNGTKKCEYRFNFLNGKVKAYVYLPKNKQQIVGILYLGAPVWHAKQEVCDIYVKNGDGDYNVMKDWIGDKKGCFVIPIEKCIKFNKPITKDQLHNFDEFIAPQTYLLLKKKPLLKEFLNDYEKQKGDEYAR